MVDGALPGGQAPWQVQRPAALRRPGERARPGLAITDEPAQEAKTLGLACSHERSEELLRGLAERLDVHGRRCATVLHRASAVCQRPDHRS